MAGETDFLMRFAELHAVDGFDIKRGGEQRSAYGGLIYIYIRRIHLAARERDLTGMRSK